MTTRHTLRAALSTIGVPLLAASMLAGCADVNQAGLSQTNFNEARANVAQAAPAASSEALPSLAPQHCDAGPAGEMQMRIMREQAFVPLMVNNTKLNLLLDTGDFVTALTPEAVTRLALPESNQPSLQMTGIGGAYQAPIVQAADVQYLTHHLNNLPFAVLPDSAVWPPVSVPEGSAAVLCTLRVTSVSLPSSSTSVGGALAFIVAMVPRSDSAGPSSNGDLPPNGRPLPEMPRAVASVGLK